MPRLTVYTPSGVLAQRFSQTICLSEALEAMGVYQSKPCGGNGKCGKCKVLLDGKEVLSCQTQISADATVVYDPDKPKVQGITEGAMSHISGGPLVEEGYGLAVDIGTTTIAGYLYHFPEGKLVRSCALPNTQAEFGADVISRIDYANRGGRKLLQQRLQEQIRALCEDIIPQKYVITGNTTMLHLLTGKDPRGIAVAPFTPESLFGYWQENAYLAPCISSYVGADITTAILASGMCDCKTALLADIGTNAEMALWHNGRLVCCSAAAGPAFEGAGIHCGMPATDGAISRVWLEEGTLRYQTIGNAPAAGICGSGLLDAVACMLELGVIGQSGYLKEAYPLSDSGVVITPGDIRQVQLAKAAVRAGIETLLEISGVSPDQVEQLYLAGGFGSYLDIQSAVAIGLIPVQLAPVAKPVGNAAGNGAVMMLLGKDGIPAAQQLASKAKTEELSSSRIFMEKYVEAMLFADPEEEG